ncbi:MAG TPA: SDR family oxidoreductase [Phototrophicaceae bacterium]|jgi:NAD(P)-dependent dehydrogenase (short-subunit alcohol dehydrogenase family)|nr:SDR family oxidoreductase [Phototrophicaceae bacterium]
MKQFEGKVALVTGGGTGIGRATALAYAEQGAKVVVAGRRLEKLEETVLLIGQIGGAALAVVTDMTSEAQVKQLIDTIIATYGRLDFAFNNAGIEGKAGPLTELTEDGFNDILNANLKSLWLSLKYEIPAMEKPGSIINNASAVAHKGIPNLAVYGASKAAVVGLTRAAAMEQARTGLRINVVSPGAVETPMSDRMFGSKEALHDNFGVRHPVGRAGKPEEIASAVIWLSSEHATFVTGQSINVDGGLTAQ